MIDQALQEKILDENGCGGWPCTFDREIEGHEVTLTSKPRFTFRDGHIQMTGSASVAIDCWFDPDIDYEAKIRFHFETDANGNKVIAPDVYDEDVASPASTGSWGHHFTTRICLIASPPSSTPWAAKVVEPRAQDRRGDQVHGRGDPRRGRRS